MAKGHYPTSASTLPFSAIDSPQGTPSSLSRSAFTSLFIFCPSSNLSGTNLNGSSHSSGSLCIAQALTSNVVPSIEYPPTVHSSDDGWGGGEGVPRSSDVGSRTIRSVGKVALGCPIRPSAYPDRLRHRSRLSPCLVPRDCLGDWIAPIPSLTWKCPIQPVGVP